MEQSVGEASTKPARPLGVWILTIYAALFDGLLPLATAVALLFTTSTAGSPRAVDLVLPLVLSTGIIAAAIGTWRGNDRSRKALLVLITAYYVLIAVNNGIALAGQGVPTEIQIKMLGRIVRGVVYPAVYIWYFRKDSTLVFYE